MLLIRVKLWYNLHDMSCYIYSLFWPSITHYLHELNNTVMGWSNWYDFFWFALACWPLMPMLESWNNHNFHYAWLSVLCIRMIKALSWNCVSALIFTDNKSKISPIYYAMNGHKQNLCLFEYIIYRVFQQCARNWIFTRKGDCILVILDTFMKKADFLL
jgi:hypothetical protein